MLRVTYDPVSRTLYIVKAIDGIRDLNPKTLAFTPGCRATTRHSSGLRQPLIELVEVMPHPFEPYSIDSVPWNSFPSSPKLGTNSPSLRALLQSFPLPKTLPGELPAPRWLLRKRERWVLPTGAAELLNSGELNPHAAISLLVPPPTLANLSLPFISKPMA
jgi:hypothetical protein